MDEQALRKRNLLFFPIGTIGRDMVYCLVTSYLLTYILFTRSLNAASWGPSPPSWWPPGSSTR